MDKKQKAAGDRTEKAEKGHKRLFQMRVVCYRTHYRQKEYLQKDRKADRIGKNGFGCHEIVSAKTDHHSVFTDHFLCEGRDVVSYQHPGDRRGKNRICPVVHHPAEDLLSIVFFKVIRHRFSMSEIWQLRLCISQ